MRKMIEYDKVYLHRTTKYDEKGNKVCIHCSASLPKRRQLYCSDRCGIDFYKQHVKDWQIIRVQIFERDRYICQECGETVTLTTGQCDHIIPLYLRGKEFDKDNLQTLCGRCHKKKTAKDRSSLGKIIAEVHQGIQKTLYYKL